MPAPRTRRIFRTAVMALAVLVLLPASYMGSVASLAYAVHADLVPAAVRTSAVTTAYVTPVEWYMRDSNLPGSESCERAMLWCCRAGERARR